MVSCELTCLARSGFEREIGREDNDADPLSSPFASASSTASLQGQCFPSSKSLVVSLSLPSLFLPAGFLLRHKDDPESAVEGVAGTLPPPTSAHSLYPFPLLFFLFAASHFTPSSSFPRCRPAWIIEQRQLDEDQRKAADADWELKMKLKARDEVRLDFPNSFLLSLFRGDATDHLSSFSTRAEEERTHRCEGQGEG